MPESATGKWGKVMRKKYIFFPLESSLRVPIMIGDMNDTKLFSPNSRPKTVIMKFTRNTDGSYHLEQAKYVKRVNQFNAYTKRIDARDAAAELREAARNCALTVR